ncbi:MAG: M67 family peptidase [Calditrichaeota bacterium]|nr:MAG: M67 family peptidase [Calditrichota bacterium]
MALQISRQHLELINAFAEEAYPFECCGFLLGKPENDSKTVLTTFPAFNAREESEKHHRFLITPEAFLQCEKFARERGLDIIGFYHSHPDAAARPSDYDVAHAWPWYAYLIVSVQNQKAVEVTSWVLRDDRSEFRPERLVILEDELVSKVG